jgi:hypothetical protein
MATPLSEQATALHDRYRKGFVGRSRATRDLGALDALITDTAAFLPALGESQTLRTQVEERLSLYRTERDTIAQIQAGGPEAVSAWRLVEWSDLSFSRYARDYAGQSRLTRDVALLEEMAAEQASWHKEAAAAAAKLGEARLKEQVAQMGKHADLYRAEVGEVRKAQAALAPADRVGALATRANRQFALWRLHFEGRPRASRRAGTLRRVVAELKDIQAAMEATRAAGITSATHAENIAKVADRVRHHGEELAKIEEARTNTPTAQLVGMLGDDANKLIARYREEFSGKSREGRDLNVLADLCEGMHEVARNMSAVAADRGTDTQNARNLTVVVDHLKVMEREFTTIRKAKQAARPRN